MIPTPEIDAHVHLWDPVRDDDILILTREPWLAEAGRPEALRRHLDASGVAGAIVVQSAPSVGHSDWLRSASRSVPGLIGVVAWMDPTAEDAMARSAVLAGDGMVCGLRLMLNRMDAPRRLLARESLECLHHLAEADLVIECLAPPAHLETVGALARALPHAQIVVDHCGMPPGPSEDCGPWSNCMRALAAQGNVSSKFSGLIEPFGPTVRLADIESRAMLCLDLFGPQRLMAASNHPVCQMGGGSLRWREMLAEIVERAGLSASERSDLDGGTALRVFSRCRMGAVEEVVSDRCRVW